jgi:hypothetical protein
MAYNHWIGVTFLYWWNFSHYLMTSNTIRRLYSLQFIVSFNFPQSSLDTSFTRIQDNHLLKFSGKKLSVLQLPRSSFSLRFYVLTLSLFEPSKHFCVKLGHFTCSINFLFWTFTIISLNFYAAVQLLISSTCFMTINLRCVITARHNFWHLWHYRTSLSIMIADDL